MVGSERLERASELADRAAASGSAQAHDEDTHALEGVRVLDLGMVWAGSICGQVLSDFGADVIKVESRANLDIARQGRPIIGEEYDPNQNPLFHNVARNKRSLAINLKLDAGRDLLRRLVEHADVLVENMRPGTLPRLGLGYDDLRQINPRLVFVSITMAGQTGPLNRMRGYGNTISGITGLDSIMGYDPEEGPLGMAHAYADPNVGLYAALMALTGLEERRHTGVGCHVDLSMWEAMVTALGWPLLDFELNGRIAGPIGNASIPGAPSGVFECEGEDAWVSIEVRTDEDWAGIVEAMGRPDWALSADYRTMPERLRRREELNARVAKWARPQSRDELSELLQQHGVIAAPCLAVGERLFDEHLTARENFVWVDNPVLGREPVYGQAMRLSATPGGVHAPAPMLGEHTDEVLREVLHISDEELERLRSEGVLE